MTQVAMILVAAVLATPNHAKPGTPQPARIATISKAVFGRRWRVASCIAHYESTDGAYLRNGSSLGPWQIDTHAHPWVNGRRLLTDWLYAARVAYRLSRGGRDWHIWTTHVLCEE